MVPTDVIAAYTKVQGKTSPGFETLARLLAQQVARNGGGSALCVYRHGEPLVDIWTGVRNRQGDPWLADTPSVCFSTTKGVVSTLFHWLMDQEQLDYDLPICHLWPQFREQGKKDLQIRDLLSHEAGLYGIRSLIDQADRMLDWQYVVDRLSSATPRPLFKHAYHGLTYGWLIGELIRRLSGYMPGELFDRALVKPLGLGACYIGVPERKVSQVASLMQTIDDESVLADHVALGQSVDGSKGSFGKRAWLKKVVRRFGEKAVGLMVDQDLVKEALLPSGIRGFKFDSAPVLRAQIPSANGVFTARGLAKLYSVMAQSGLSAGLTPNGRRFIAESRVQVVTEQQNHGLDAVIPMPMGWRLGYHRVLNYKRALPRAVAHYGYGGSGAWADPDSGVSVGFVVNAGQGTPFGDFRMMQINHEIFRLMGKLDK